MKKVFLISIILVMICGITQSQIKLGIRAGLSTASYTASDYNDVNYSIKKLGDAEYGYHFGLIGQVKLFGIFVQPELLLTSASNSYRLNDIYYKSETKINNKTYNLEFPIIFGYKIGLAKLEAGPVGSILLYNSSSNSSYNYNFNSATWAFQVGAGLELFKFTADLKYEFGLSNLGSGVTINGHEYPFAPKVSQLIFSIGYFF